MSLAHSYSSEDYKIVYLNEKATLSGIRVVDEATGEAVEKCVTFRVFNATTQEFVGCVRSCGGILSDIELVRGQHYIVYCEDTEYSMDPFVYFTMNGTGELPVSDKIRKGDSAAEVDSFRLSRRAEPISEDEVKDCNRVSITIPVKHWDFKEEDYSRASFCREHNVKISFTSEYDSFTVAVDQSGNITGDFIEDIQYMVNVKGKDYEMESFPLVIKDHSESNLPKAPYTHLCCGGVQRLIIFDSGKKPVVNTEMRSTSGKTVISGFNWANENEDTDYTLNERYLDDYRIEELKGRDYDVLDIDAINMYRGGGVSMGELSKHAVGSYDIRTTLPSPAKSVGAVYYIDGNGRLVPIEFTQNGGTLSFRMNSLSITNNVILYGKRHIGKVSISKTSYIYDSKKHTPAITVTDSNGCRLSKGADYKVSGKTSARLPGKYNVRISGIGNTDGTASKSYKVIVEPTKIRSVNNTGRNYTVRVERRSSARVTGYQIRYSTSKTMSKARKVTVGTKSSAVTKRFNNLKPGKSYYFQARSYKKTGGRKYYSKWSPAATVIRPAKMSLSVSNRTVDINGRAVIRVKSMQPANASKAVTYKSANSKIATVSSKGVVTGKRAGKTKITVTSKKNKQLRRTVTINVKNLKADSVVVSCENVKLSKGASTTVTAKINAPAGYFNQGVSWRSSDPDVARVDAEGRVTAVSMGRARIIAAVKDGSRKSGSVEIRVTPTFENATDAELKELADNDWEGIEWGSEGWNVGDERYAELGSQYTGSFKIRIVDISHARDYNPDAHAVFEFVKCVSHCSFNSQNISSYIGSDIEAECESIYKAMTPELQSVIKTGSYPTGIYTNPEYGAEGYQSDYEISETANIEARLTVPAEKEIYGVNSMSAAVEAQQLNQFDYYKDRGVYCIPDTDGDNFFCPEFYGMEIVSRRYVKGYSDVSSWLRSPTAAIRNCVCILTAGGGMHNQISSFDDYVCPIGLM